MIQDGPKEDEKLSRLPGWPPPPKMQIWMIVGACVAINIVLIGVWLLVVFLR